MRVRDSRPPFAGLANLSEEQLHRLPTPCYLLDEAQLRRNGEILLGVQQRTGCRILLAQKAFSNFNVYPVLAPYLAGTEASGLYESRLGKEELPEKENRQEKVLDRIFLEEILGTLEAKERRLIYMRYFQNMTQMEIAHELGVSQVQVSRMEKRILRSLQESAEKK